MSMSSAPAPRCELSRSRILLWPTLVGLAVPVLLVLISATPVWFPALFFLWFPVAIMPMVWLLAAVAALVMAVDAARDGLWLRAVSAMALPTIVAGAMIYFFSFMHLCMYAGDRLHFMLVRNAYLSEVAALPADNQPHLKVWNWGGFVQSKGVVYDQSDEIALPEQSAAWKVRAKETELGCGYGYEAMGDHLYLAAFGC